MSVYQAQNISFLLSQVRSSTKALSLGKVYFYAAGTSVVKSVWLDPDKTTLAANPYTLDINGTANLFADGNYRILIKDSDGVTVFDRDNLWFNDSLGEHILEANSGIQPKFDAALATEIGGYPVGATLQDTAGLNSYVNILANNTTNFNTTPDSIGVSWIMCCGPGLIVADASTTVKGKVELATDAEAQTGTDTTRAVTPANLSARTSTESRTGLIELATAAEALAGTDTAKALTPAGIRSAFSASGTAPVYACRGWVSFNGTGTVTIESAGNVSSITDRGTGKYTVNFTVPLSTSTYAVSCSGIHEYSIVSYGVRTTSTCEIKSFHVHDTVYYDNSGVSVTFFE